MQGSVMKVCLGCLLGSRENQNGTLWHTFGTGAIDFCGTLFTEY
jgi:hypothetical protein